ncbi:MAG: hypothetical protein ACOCQX_03085 [Candidatus Nanoarchaeia archaeon]
MPDIFEEIKRDLESQIWPEEKILPEEFDEFYPNKTDEKSSFINDFVIA